MQLHLDVWDDAYRGLMPQEILDERRAKLDERIERWSLSSRPSTSPMRTISRGIVRRSGPRPAPGPAACRTCGSPDRGVQKVGPGSLNSGDRRSDMIPPGLSCIGLVTARRKTADY